MDNVLGRRIAAKVGLRQREWFGIAASVGVSRGMYFLNSFTIGSYHG